MKINSHDYVLAICSGDLNATHRYVQNKEMTFDKMMQRNIGRLTICEAT